MKIRHERPMPDLAFRVRAPLQLELQSGDVVEVREWSQTGLIYPVESNVLPKKGYLSIPFQGVDIRFAVTFVKGNDAQELLFKDLSGRQREIIGVFYRSILSGKMASAGDMITSLDTPVDLVPMGETEDEAAVSQTKARPRAIRIIWNIAFYAVLAGVLFGLVGGQVWDRLTRLNLSNARVVAPIASHTSVEAAYVDSILVTPGQSVTRGQTLVKLSNPDRNGRLEDIRRDIARAGKSTRRARDVLQSHQKNQSVIRAGLLVKYKAARNERDQRDFFAGNNLQRVTALWKEFTDFDTGVPAGPGDFHDIRLQLKSRLDDAKEVERRLKRDLSNAKSGARTADIVAAADGIVAEVFVFQNEYLARGKQVLNIEENVPRFVQAWVNETRADAIYVGMAAEVTFRNALGKRTHAGVISEVRAGIDPDTDNGFGMIVSVALPEFDLTESRKALRENAPVKVRALKDWRGGL